jgi:hypothetical protein
MYYVWDSHRPSTHATLLDLPSTIEVYGGDAGVSDCQTKYQNKYQEIVKRYFKPDATADEVESVFQGGWGIEGDKYPLHTCLYASRGKRKRGHPTTGNEGVSSSASFL